eukprot:gene19977-23907_t
MVDFTGSENATSDIEDLRWSAERRSPGQVRVSDDRRVAWRPGQVRVSDDRRVAWRPAGDGWGTIVSEPLTESCVITLEVKNRCPHLFVGIALAAWQAPERQCPLNSAYAEPHTWLYRASGELHQGSQEVGRAAPFMCNTDQEVITLQLHVEMETGTLSFRHGAHVASIDISPPDESFRIVASLGETERRDSPQSVQIMNPRGCPKDPPGAIHGRNVMLVSTLKMCMLALPRTGVEAVAEMLLETASSLPPLGLLPELDLIFGRHQMRAMLPLDMVVMERIVEVGKPVTIWEASTHSLRD